VTAGLPPDRAHALPGARTALHALPPGTLAVGAGVLGLGLSSYGFLVLAGRGLGSERFAVLSVFWVIVYTVGPGLFVPLEQEVARAVAARRATGVGNREVVRTAGRVALLAASVLTVALLVAAPLLRDKLFAGSSALLGALLLAVWALCAAHLSRGAMAGTGRFGAYGAQLGTEATVRLVLCAALVAAGITVVLVYGIVLGLAVVVALVATVPALRGELPPGPRAPASELSTNLGLLLTASLLSQAVANAGPVVVQLADPDDAAAAGRFLAAFVVARVPLFLFASVQAALLPRLTTLAAQGELTGFRRALRRILVVVVGVGAVGVLGSLTVGPEAVRLFFGDDFALARTEMALLALGAGLFMVATVLAQACLALGRHASTVIGWAAGAAALAVATALVPGAVSRATWGFVAAAAVAGAALAVLVRRDSAAAARVIRS
jgi:O-antigen/teichoic acid export membrane protein